jgi:TolA-binding protein
MLPFRTFLTVICFAKQNMNDQSSSEKLNTSTSISTSDKTKNLLKEEEEVALSNLKKSLGDFLVIELRQSLREAVQKINNNEKKVEELQEKIQNYEDYIECLQELIHELQLMLRNRLSEGSFHQDQHEIEVPEMKQNCNKSVAITADIKDKESEISCPGFSDIPLHDDSPPVSAAPPIIPESSLKSNNSLLKMSFTSFKGHERSKKSFLKPVSSRVDIGEGSLNDFSN